MLAREGYIVLELGYNLPRYGQESLFTRKTSMPLEYFEEAIKQLLAHPKSYGNKVAVLGQSKGVDLAIGVATMMPHLVELAITNSGHMLNPMGVAQTYGHHIFQNTCSFRPTQMLRYVPRGWLTMDRDGFVRMPSGQHRFYHINFDPLFPQQKNGGWSINYSVASEMKRIGYQLELANKIVHCQTLEDPTHSSGLCNTRIVIAF